MEGEANVRGMPGESPKGGRFVLCEGWENGTVPALKSSCLKSLAIRIYIDQMLFLGLLNMEFLWQITDMSRRSWRRQAVREGS